MGNISNTRKIIKRELSSARSFNNNNNISGLSELIDFTREKIKNVKLTLKELGNFHGYFKAEKKRLINTQLEINKGVINFYHNN